MDIKEQLQNYADLIVRYGMNVQPGQHVRLGIDACNRDFALDIVRAAYGLGAALVTVDLIDRRFDRERILHNSLEQLAYVPKYVPVKFNELVDGFGATASVRGEEDPDLMSDLPENKLSKLESSVQQALEYFYDLGISKSHLQWTVAAASTPNWARRIFPNLPAEQAHQELWRNILKICRCDRSDYLAVWQKHDAMLKRRCRQLNELQIDRLHFTGPGCDLAVGLTDKARFMGGASTTPKGHSFEPNLPSEECFTTPDLRRTNGVVRSTRPVLINGKLVSGLEMHFREGKLEKFSAKEGAETFQQMLDTDAGARYLGEVALVGIDSPVFQSGLVFESILYDENAACHIALGRAYKFCIQDGDSLKGPELAENGINHSIVHKDIMISDERVSVTAHSRSGDVIELIKDGQWTSNFAE